MRLDVLLTIALLLGSPALSGNEAHEILSRMSPEKRNDAMTQHLTRSNEPCNVSRTFFQGFDRQSTAHWNVGCSNGQAYVVSIRNDAPGSTRILDCKVLKAAANVDCFKKF
jgi:hypothetical protein